MSEPNLSFFNRLVLAFSTFWQILINAEFAARMDSPQLSTPEPTATPVSPPRPALQEALPDSALQLLGLLQQEGRFVDFLQEDVSQFSDAEIGGAARVVHEGCRKAIHEHFRFEPVREEAENARLTLAEGFDAASVRLTGNVVGSPPFTGTLKHHGWRVAEINLPKLAQGHDVRIVAPAEVEL